MEKSEPISLDLTRLLRSAQRGDRTALAKLIGQLADPWYRLAVGLLSCPDLAADAAQESATRFLAQIGTFRGQSQLRTWALGICLNVVREMRRRRRNEMERTPKTGFELRRSSELPEKAALSEEERNIVHSTLEQLSDRQREAIVLRYFEELSVEQTAAVMNCAKGTVKATVHQALRAMREMMLELI